jgi:Zn-finger protein
MRMQASFRFFSNTKCRYFPCHAGDPARFNCLFCYCPLYLVPECGGNPRYAANGLKDCSACLRPHLPEAYDEILEVLRRLSDRANTSG